MLNECLLFPQAPAPVALALTRGSSRFSLEVHMQSLSRSNTLAMPVGLASDQDASQRVLRNTYGLLSMTLLFSAATAAAAVAWQLPGPGVILTWLVYFGLLFGIHKLQTAARPSAWSSRSPASWATRSGPCSAACCRSRVAARW